MTQAKMATVMHAARLGVELPGPAAFPVSAAEATRADAFGTCPATRGVFNCTLPPGHEGDHVAQGAPGRECERWSSEATLRAEVERLTEERNEARERAAGRERQLSRAWQEEATLRERVEALAKEWEEAWAWLVAHGGLTVSVATRVNELRKHAQALRSALSGERPADEKGGRRGA